MLNRVLRHNVRNEMSIIHNYADIIRDFTDDEQIAQAAGTVLEAGGQLTDLSDKARQIRNAFDDADRRHGVDAATLVADAVEDARTAFPDTDIRYTVPEGVTVVGLPALDMALANVLENACEHNDADEPTVEVDVTFDGTAQPEEAPTLDLDAAAEDDSSSDPLAADRLDAGETTGRVHVAVADNGPGIPSQEHEVLTAGKETALEHGSGLGLWLIFWIVDRSGGELVFETNDPRGSVVTMVLPAAGPADGV